MDPQGRILEDDLNTAAGVKGTEMRLIEAEATLNNGHLATAMARINEARAHYGLDALESDGTIGSITGGEDGGAPVLSLALRFDQ